MTGLIDIVKRSGGILVVILLGFWIGALVLLQLLASAVTNFPKLKKEPRVIMTETVPTTTTNGCTTIDGIQICPERMEQPQ